MHLRPSPAHPVEEAMEDELYMYEITAEDLGAEDVLAITRADSSGLADIDGQRRWHGDAERHTDQR